MIKKFVNPKVKAILQSSSGTKKFNFKYPKSHKLIAKKDKNKTNLELWDKNKAKSHNYSHTNTSQTQTQV